MASVNFPNIDFGFRRGNKQALLSKGIENGTLNFTKDTREMYVDIDNTRIEISEIVYKNTEAEIRATLLPEQKVYIALDTMKMLFYSTATMSWCVIGGDSVSTADSAKTDAKGHVIDEYYYPLDDATAEINTRDKQVAEINAKISAISKLNMKVIESGEALPDTGESNIIYLIDETNPSTTSSNDVYSMYVWVVTSTDAYGNTSGYYAKIGVTTIDLEAYSTITATDTKIAAAKAEVETDLTTAKNDLTATINTTRSDLTTVISSNTTEINNVKANYATNAAVADTYATKTELSDLNTNVTSSINAIPARIIQIIESGQSLPTTGTANTLYFVDETNPSTASSSDSYGMYVWIADGAYYSKIGASASDLADYAKKTDTEAIAAEVATIKTDMTSFNGTDEG